MFQKSNLRHTLLARNPQANSTPYAFRTTPGGNIVDFDSGFLSLPNDRRLRPLATRAPWTRGQVASLGENFFGSVVLRGRRTVSDRESEFTMALANHTLAADVETVFLMATERYSHISSTLIRQIARLGREASRGQLVHFVPPAVVEPLIGRFAAHGGAKGAGA